MEDYPPELVRGYRNVNLISRTVCQCVIPLISLVVLIVGIVLITFSGDKKAAPAVGPPPKVCAACGTKNPPGYEFCDRCGERL
jgi:hypothetical protein